MKNINYLGIFLIATFLVAACDQNPQPSESLASAADDTAYEHVRKHADPKYICPMHSEIIRDKPDNCPICGMDLVPIEIETAEPLPSEPLARAMDDTAYEHVRKHADPKYICPMHSEIIRDKPDNCPICGMDLVPIETDVSGTNAEKEVLYWVAPMDPNFRRDAPGKSPMGMDLVPVYAEEATQSGPAVRIRPHIQQQLGIRTETVTLGKLDRQIRTVGQITYDEDRLAHIHPRSTGWIERIRVRALGAPVRKGDVLFEYYAPEIVQAQEEYLVARRSSGNLVASSKNSLMKSARLRLELLDIPEHLIRKLDSKGEVQRLVPVLSPQDGYITEIGVRDGMYISPEMVTYSIADLSQVWVMVDVFDEQLAWVRPGDAAAISLTALPGKTWEGTVDYIYPELSRDTRTLNIRLRFDNADGLLRPNMYADVSIRTAEPEATLIIPHEAVIRGSGETRVIRRLEDGSFAPAMVELGIRNADRVEVLSGLAEGDEIVASGHFLIDSESNLKASLQRLLAESE